MKDEEEIDLKGEDEMGKKKNALVTIKNKRHNNNKNKVKKKKVFMKYEILKVNKQGSVEAKRARKSIKKQIAAFLIFVLIM